MEMPYFTIGFDNYWKQIVFPTGKLNDIINNN